MSWLILFAFLSPASECGPSKPETPFPQLEKWVEAQLLEEAHDWVGKNFKGLEFAPMGSRASIDFVVSCFLGRLKNYEAYSEGYDRLYAQFEEPLKYRYFTDLQDGIFLAVFGKRQRITDLEPFKKVRFEKVEDVFGYDDYDLPFSRLIAEASRQELVISSRELRSRVHGVYQVLFHEFGHLVHLTLLTEEEFQTLDRLFKQAQAQPSHFLDDYQEQSNSEYFSQGLEAYLSVYKTHERWRTDPYLNHTREDLKKKDPGLYAFVESLVDPRCQKALD